MYVGHSLFPNIHLLTSTRNELPRNHANFRHGEEFLFFQIFQNGSGAKEGNCAVGTKGYFQRAEGAATFSRISSVY
jgi:hypothetical protein